MDLDEPDPLLVPLSARQVTIRGVDDHGPTVAAASEVVGSLTFLVRSSIGH